MPYHPNNRLYIICLILVGLFFYTLTLRGTSGNLDTIPVLTALRNNPGAFESSHESSSYAFMLSLVKDHSISLSRELADFGTPDVGFYKDKFYSFFPPGIAVLMIPSYLLGRLFNLSQIFAYATIPLITIGNLILLYYIARKILMLPAWASAFASLTYGFATTSWSYAVTIFQHQVSVFLILLSFYAAWQYGKNKSSSWVWACVAWTCYGISIFFDYPNGILLLPSIIYMIAVSFNFSALNNRYKLTFRTSILATSLIFFSIMGAHFLYNIKAFGEWKKLHNTLPIYTIENFEEVSTNNEAVAKEKSNPLSIFRETNLPNSLEVMIVSPNRGLFYYSPILLFALFGIFAIRKRITLEVSTLLALVIVNIFFYASNGDPWGGRAFGPRYIIPAMAILPLFISYWLSYTRFKLAGRISVFVFYMFSSAVALLGALTTNMLRKTDEAISFGVPYDYRFNLDYLRRGISGSFIYNNYVSNHLTLTQYFLIIYSLIGLLIFTVLFLLPKFESTNHD